MTTDRETTYRTQGSTVGYSKSNKIFTVDFHDSREILFENHNYFNANVFYFFTFIYF